MFLFRWFGLFFFSSPKYGSYTSGLFNYISLSLEVENKVGNEDIGVKAKVGVAIGYEKIRLRWFRFMETREFGGDWTKLRKDDKICND